LQSRIIKELIDVQQKEFYKSGWKCRSIFVFVLTLLSFQASAFQLSPSLIFEDEGTSIALVLTYEASDWRAPNQEMLDICTADGFSGTNWVAQFQLQGVSGTADFSNDDLSGDLHYTHNGSAQPSTLNYYRCDESVSNPGEQVSNNFTIELNIDGLEESEETAEFRVYDRDFDDNLVFHDDIGIFINDAANNHGVLSICCDSIISESDPFVTVSVSRMGGSEGAISVDYLTGAVEQTATSDVDYVNTFGTLHWADGDASDRFIDIPIIDDSEYEDFEYFWIDIVNPMGGATLDLEYYYAAIDIEDNDDPVGAVMINSFNASPSTIDTHDTTTISWSVSNATMCTPTGGTAGWDALSISLPSGSVQLTLTKAGSFVFGLTCSDDFTIDIANTTVDVIGPPPVTIDSFTVTPDTVDPGQSATLSWVVSNAESCTALGGTGGWAGSIISLPSGSTMITFPDPGVFDFELNCSNESSAVLDNVLVTVTAPPEVSIDSFMASPNPVAEGGSTTLSWLVSNADSCSASDGAGGWAGSLISLPSGSVTVTLPATGDIVFTLECSNSFGSSDSAMVTVTVEANPSVQINTFTASPNVIDEGQSTMLSWSVSNADSCTASEGDGGWAGSAISLPSGSLAITLTTAGTVNFTLTCSNSFESTDTATVTVTVAPPDVVVIGTFDASPNVIEVGQASLLSWDVSNADSCAALGGVDGWEGSTISLPSGSRSVTPATAGSYTFTLRCSNDQGSSDSASVTVTVNEPAVVAITSFTASPNPIEEGESTTLSWTVNNADSCTASGGAGGWEGSQISLPSGNQTVTLTAVGPYLFTLTCSNSSESSDTAETMVTVQAGAAPDLAASDVETNATLLKPGEDLLVSGTIANVGTASAGASTIRYYLSANNVIDASDMLLGLNASPTLGLGIQYAAEFEAVVPAELGSYWVGICVEALQNETNVTNNCSTGPQITIESGQACNTRAISCGETLTGSLSSSECTDGPRGPGYYTQKFTYNGSIGDPLFIDATWNGSLDGFIGLQNPSSITVATNDNYTSTSDSHIEYQVGVNGIHTISATSFAPGASGTYSITLECMSPPGPDLTLSMPSIDTNPLISGQGMKVSTSLMNVGDRTSDSGILHYVLSSDAKISLSDSILGTDAAPALESGGFADVMLPLQAPTASGNYFMGVCVEPVADEASVSNNCSAGRPFTVSARPECTTRTLACGGSVSGSLTTQDCTSSPRGSGFLAEEVVIDHDDSDFVSITAEFGGRDGYLMLGIEADGSQGSSSGQILAENDDWQSFDNSRIEYELTESGSYFVVATTGLPAVEASYELFLDCGSDMNPDLLASEVFTDAEIVVGDQLMLDATVQNMGGSSATSSTVYFLLSSDSGISLESDTVLGSSEIAALEPGASAQVSLLTDALAEAGTYWVGICVDPVDGETITNNNCSQLTEASVQSSMESADKADGKSKIETFGPKGTRVIVSFTPNDESACNNSMLSCGQSQSGALSPGDCDQSPRGAGYYADLFTFSGTAGQVVSLNAEWSGVDGYLYLEAPDGSLLAENDDFQDKEHSRFEHELESSGTYRVWPTAFSEGEVGSYDLSLGCDAATAPDLVVDKPQISTSSARPGQSVVVTTEASNQGNGPADPTQIEFILASSPSLSESDHLLGTADVAGLSGGASTEKSLMVSLNVTPGMYWVGTCVASDVTELDSDNNCDVTGPITVEETETLIPINTGLNDAWFNADTNGQGFFFNVFPDGNTVFLSWFTFDINRPDNSVPFELGDPGQRWLTAQGGYDQGVASLNVFLTEGGRFDSGTPVPVTDPQPYGTMTVSFSDCNHGEINFDLPSVSESGTIQITRVSGDNITECENQIGSITSENGVARQGLPPANQVEKTIDETSRVENATAGTLQLSQGFSDAWFNPLTNGQGFFVNVFPTLGQVFLSWFTYDIERPPGDVTALLGEPGHRWITAQGPFDGETATLTIYSTSGGIFNEGTPAPVSVADGTINLTFSDCNTGLIDYTITSLGLSGTVPIERLARDSIPGCEVKSEDSVKNLALSPKKGDVLENLCEGSVDWVFDWPDDPRASRYDFRLFRNDNELEFASNLFTKVKESKFTYQKLEAVPDAHREGWKWQYKPVYSGFGAKANWSELQTFDAKTTADPCLD
jgi:hypothetical protein